MSIWASGIFLTSIPSIGDWYPERNIFQILIAITSGPRFSLVFLQYFLNRQPYSSLSGWVFIVGIIRTFSCGGWVYITSNDDHDIHDVLMATYIICNVPWMLGSILCTPPGHLRSRRRRWGAIPLANVILLILFSGKLLPQCMPTLSLLVDDFLEPSHMHAQVFWVHDTHVLFLCSAQGVPCTRRYGFRFLPLCLVHDSSVPGRSLYSIFIL